MCQILSKLGYDVFCPNFRGSSGYGRSFMESIDNRWGINDLEDLVSVVNIVRDKNKNNKYILMGESYGAFLALKSIIMSPLQWDAGILLSPFISPTSLFNISSKKVKTFLNLKSGLSHTGLHKENYDEYMYRNINSKLLILHSDIDSTIPIKESIKLTQSLINAGKIEGKDFTFKKFTNADHKMNNEWMNHYISNVIEFLKTC